ncbi:hypothetical protein EOA33_14910 [Mesorhizobium sp. M4A.F.Ca.ET.050.02.1.1]|uniref:hypothetical protein n=1 Tax=Mesorhizobium sp. M4A.F.Ca.ET.050.02.1.1 TaxID=2496754 RepID=UPI000FC99906|nr:hypothetical protein [Mesorhizobium sp. M4A.F.Ca.ET.050.02.1.1]RUX48653.1 hypothetical protein EOA33_14910 [Mesorhizobium sp. M4A.F.Ca.ET.050.02.1.1]
MGRRSNFPRIAKDLYCTPAMALPPLLMHLPDRVRYLEPTAGNGALVRGLAEHGHICQLAIDIDPTDPNVICRDAISLTAADVGGIDMIIGNLPWSWAMFQPLLEHLLTLGLPVWILRDTPWLFNRRSSALVRRCALMQPTRRLRWIPNTKHTAKDDCAWHFFPGGQQSGPQILPRLECQVSSGAEQ